MVGVAHSNMLHIGGAFQVLAVPIKTLFWCFCTAVKNGVPHRGTPRFSDGRAGVKSPRKCFASVAIALKCGALKIPRLRIS